MDLRNSALTNEETTVSGGFNSAVGLSATGQPSGVTVSFNPASIASLQTSFVVDDFALNVQ